jgi:hypothetical protein
MTAGTTTTASAGLPGKITRIALTIALVPVGRIAFKSWDEEAWIPLISDINLAVHEFGHMLFMPLGETMTIAGGSIFQVAFPLIFAGYFAFSKKHADLHAATICLWWAAVSLANVAIYANDARAGQLMLVNGQIGAESDGHDFYNLFARWGVLERDQIYARHLRRLAAFGVFVSVAAGIFFALFPRKRPLFREAESEE